MKLMNSNKILSLNLPEREFASQINKNSAPRTNIVKL